MVWITHEPEPLLINNALLSEPKAYCLRMSHILKISAGKFYTLLTQRHSTTFVYNCHI